MLRFRPRPKFSLRTLWVLVTLIGIGFGWVAHELHIGQQRSAIRQWIAEKNRGSWIVAESDRHLCEEYVRVLYGTPHEYGDRGMSWPRRLLGDEWFPCELLYFPISTEERQRIQQAFPELDLHTVTAWQVDSPAPPRP